MTVIPGCLELRRMGLQDLTEVVGAHLSSFPHGFFAKLGRHFLTRYYRTFLDGPLSVAMVAEIDGRFYGYLVGILDPPRHRRLLLSYHGWALAGWGLFGLAHRPLLLARFLVTRTRRYGAALLRNKSATAAPSTATPVAVLSHVVVAPQLRKAGIGATLVENFMQQARAAGCQRACLVTVDGPDGAGAFYAKYGWIHTHTRRGPDGRPLAHYERTIYEG